MWSCGVMIFILLGGYMPFDESEQLSAKCTIASRPASTSSTPRSSAP